MSVQSTLSKESVHFYAQKGSYYDKEKDEWQSTGRLEQLVRYIFRPFVDSLEVACTKRSWKNIVKLENLPEKIVQGIDNLFDESRKGELRIASRSIAEIYARVWQQRNGKECHFQIQENNKRRLFEIKNDKQVMETVVSSGYAVLDFYQGGEKKFVNKHDDLLDPSQQLVGRVKKVSYFSKDAERDQYCTHLALFKGDSRLPSFIVQREGDDTTFVVREDKTNKMLAIALWSKDAFQNWSVTLTEPKYWTKNLNLLNWVLLKHSQSYLGGERERPYVKDYLK